MADRPKLKLSPSITDKAIELFGWIALAGLWWLAMSSYHDLPDVIPTHFNLAGLADGFGGKSNLIVLPAICTLLFLGITALNRFPHLFNYPVAITNENAEYQYTLATQMLRMVKLILVFIFSIIIYQSITVAHGAEEGLGSWVIPTTLVLVFIPLIYFLIRSTAKH